jgi:hypothetical protein
MADARGDAKGMEATNPLSRLTDQPALDAVAEPLKGGKGRKDDVRGSRIYPASSPDAPVDADVRTVRDFVKHRGPESKHPKGFKRAI